MAQQGGFGVQLKIMVSTTLTAIANLLDVDYPRLMKYIAESTAHDSTDGYYEAIATGKRRVEPFTARIAWDDSETTHTAIITAFDADTAVSMSIADPDSSETLSFSAHIEAIGRIAKQEGIYEAEVAIHPTGKATLT